jgi:DNA-binding response OmpR family regulator
VAALKRCECCGQIIPPKQLFDGKPVKQRIYDYIAKHPEGVTREQILDFVWADDIDGGPEFKNIVSVHIEKMRPILIEIGLTITRSRGPGSTYRLVAVEDRQPNRRTS